MRKRIGIFLVLFILTFSVRVFAAENINIKASINGEIKKGKQIEILINFDEIKSLYAGALYYKYDPKVLKITEIIPGDLINKSDINKFEATKNIDSEKGLVSYAFTCVGDINGFSGKGNFIKLKAEVLGEEDFKITSSFSNKTPNDEYTMRLQVCDSNIVELPYSFTGVNYTLKSGQEPIVNSTSETSTKVSDSNAGSAWQPSASNSNNTNSIEKPANNSTVGSNEDSSSNKTITTNDGNKVNEKDNNNREQGNNSEANENVNNSKSGLGSTTYSQGLSQSKSQQISKILVYIFGGAAIVSLGSYIIYKIRK